MSRRLDWQLVGGEGLTGWAGRRVGWEKPAQAEQSERRGKTPKVRGRDLRRVWAGWQESPFL